MKVQRALKGFDVLWDPETHSLALASPIYDNTWEWDEEYQAFVGYGMCLNRYDKSCDTVPNPDCACGIHGVYHLEDAWPYSSLIGLVRPAGRVIPAAKGWRAEKAYVEALALCDPMTEVIDYLPAPLRERLMPLEVLLKEREVEL